MTILRKLEKTFTWFVYLVSVLVAFWVGTAISNIIESPSPRQIQYINKIKEFVSPS